MDPLRGDEATADPDELTFATAGRELDAVPVAAALSALPGPTTAWSEGTERFAAGGSAATIRASGPGRFESIRRAGESLFADRSVQSELPRVARPRLFGGFAFHGDKTDGRSPWRGFPGAQFVLPTVQVISTGEGESTWLVANATGPDAQSRARAGLDRWATHLSDAKREPAADKPGIASKTYTPDENGWRRQVEAAIRRIRRGTLRKVVLAQALTTDLEREISIPEAYARLSATYPDCFRFLVAPEDGGQFFGATPERLVTRNGRTVTTEALAGSTGRGETTAEDEWLAERLLDSEKDGHEHELVVEAIKDQLDPLTTAISTGERTVRKLATVQHLQTPVTAELADDSHVLALVKALHPTPAVGGLPPDEALETIRETETFDRGWYASPVGWFDADGDGTFAVAIRSAVATDRRVTLFAGNGIVADSDPDREWDEVQLKYPPVLDVLE